MSKTHSIKCWPKFFALVITRAKEFELRLNDRNYKFGDILRLREYDPERKACTGRVAICHVTCALTDLPGLMPGYVAMGIFFLKMETGKQEAA